ncbi:hypothetical protein PVAND_007460 [Polypedilum vanderplanki]|uniref:Uncharacterized protein n=1 Tax=Polypedilum vanderplanki TaxID=319348 RepID=A0A9J6C6L2_POLVA|nr:hypothetical protein PVAND_007460 [Polypedilum vanderplanki]
MKYFTVLLFIGAQFIVINSLPTRSTLKKELDQFNDVINIQRISEIIREYWENDPSIQALIKYLKSDSFMSALNTFVKSEEVDDIIEWMQSHGVDIKLEIEEFSEDISSIHQSSLILQQFFYEQFSLSTFEEEIRNEIKYDKMNELIDNFLQDGNDFAQLYLILKVSKPSLENIFMNAEIQNVIGELKNLGRKNAAKNRNSYQFTLELFSFVGHIFIAIRLSAMGNQSSKTHKEKYSRKNVHWKSAEPPHAPGKPYLLPGVPSDEPDVVTIKWQKPTLDGGSSIIGYIVEHKRTGSPNWIRANQQLIQLTELTLTGLEPGWRYQFRIIAENAVGCSPPSEASDPLTVTLQRNAVQSTAPKFLAELEDLNGIENEKVEFKVRVIGTPAPQISWFKDGFEIFSSRRAKIITENDTSTLIFYQSSLTDEGEIKCTATNRAGYAFTKARLIIEAPPKIRLPRQYEDGLIIEAEEVIRLKVGLAGRPIPLIEWSHNGEIITSGGRYEISSNDKNSTLKITNTCRTDRGEYHLKASNSLGEDSTSFLVTVTARPTQPGKIAIKILPANTVTLTWAPPDDDGGCKIGNYIVEYFRIGWNVWLKAATCRTLAVTLNDLIPGSEYKFRVKAENPYGVSDPSEDSDILFIPDIKRGITDPTKSKSQPQLGLDSDFAPRRKLSPSPARSKLTENIEEQQQKKAATIPRIKLNTKIFDDETIERDMNYGASDDFYKFGEVPSTSLHEKSELEHQVRQLKNAKNNVKFNDNLKTTKVEDEPIYANLPKDKPQETREDLRKYTGKRTYLDLSKTGGDADRSIQNSSEFMLVLYADKDSKGEHKNDSFELDDYFELPRPLSQSAPELNAIVPEGPILRTAVSSTELLYERAMARFYKAVEYEQTETARKRSISVDQEARRRSFSVDQEGKKVDAQESALTRLRINSLPESEKMSVLRRRLSGEVPNLHINIPKRLSFSKDEESDETDATYLNTLRNEEPYSDERSPSPYMLAKEKNEEQKFSDDYTDSTESSDDEEASPRRSRYRTTEKDTYHARMLSPYRQPQKGEAAEVLTKLKSPIPDPNFVPKPILKRPASADGRKPTTPITPQLIVTSRRSLSPSPPINRIHRKSVEIDTTPVIIQDLIDDVKTEIVPEVPRIKVEEPIIKQPSPPKPEPEPEEEEFKPDPEVIKRNEQTKRKMLERRQSSIEENKVMADFYGDIIKTHSLPTKPKIPIYMDPEALKKLEAEEEQQHDSGVISSAEISPQSSISKPVQQQQNRSPSPFSRRSSDVAKISRPFSPPPKNEEIIKSRRASDSMKIQNAIGKENFSNLPLKDTIETFKSNYNRLELNKSPSPHNFNTSEASSTDELQTRGRLIEKSPKVTGTLPKRRKASKSRSRDSSMIRTPIELNSQPTRRMKSSSRTRNRSESKSPTAMNRKIIINRVAPQNTTPKYEPSSPSPPLSSRTATPSELQEEVTLKVKSNMTYATDVSILAFATYLYFFKSALLALPILILLIYRQIANKIPDWLKKKKKS